MIEVKMVDQADEKTAITLHIMLSLRDWFNPEDDIRKKSLTHRTFPFFAAYNGESVIGFAALKIHNEYTADIYTIGVLERYHRQGAGKLLIKEIERYCLAQGHQFLTVKTLDVSADYEPYNRTRAFYRKMGFIPLEVFPTLWDSDNPCLFLAKIIGK